MPVPVFIVLAGVFLFLFAWPYIREFFSTRIIPALRKRLGDKVADIVSKVIYWVDTPACMARSAFISAFNTFKRTFLSVQTERVRKSATEVKSTTDAYLTQEDGTLVRMQVDTVEDISQVPPDVRKKWIQQNADGIRTNDLDTIEEGVKKTAEKQKIELGVA